MIQNKVILLIPALALLPALSPMSAMADEPQTGMSNPKDLFSEFKKKSETEFDDFRNRANKEYADFMRQAWEAFELLAPLEVPQEAPVAPEEYTGDEPAVFETAAIDVKETNAVNYITLDMYAPKPKPQPMPVSIIKTLPWAEQGKHSFDYYGTTLGIRFDASQKISIPKLNNDVLADMWLKMSAKEYNNTINDCLELRNSLSLNDWAYLQLLHKFAVSVYGDTNEAMLTASFLYAQSGYRMRLFQHDGKLSFLYASDQTIFGKSRMNVDGTWLYSFDDTFGGASFCNMPFPQEQNLQLPYSRHIELDCNYSAKRTLQSRRYPEMRAEVSVDLNLIQFYNDYPAYYDGENSRSRWAMYANAPFDERVKQELYPPLQEALNGCSQRTSVNKLLNFMHTAFKYEYDDKVWGYDRAFFGEETLYYPYCDCEDRAILLSRLVRDLLGIPVVLVYFPGHLATAVALDDEKAGEAFITVDGRRYTIADPTYIGSYAGMTMSSCPASKASAILLD